LQLFDISKKNAENIYKYYRCDIVHTGPTAKTTKITDKNNKEIQIESDWFIEILDKLLSMVNKKDWTLNTIVAAQDWRTKDRPSRLKKLLRKFHLIQ